jgi:hypothetical protein
MSSVFRLFVRFFIVFQEMNYLKCRILFKLKCYCLLVKFLSSGTILTSYKKGIATVSLWMLPMATITYIVLRHYILIVCFVSEPFQNPQFYLRKNNNFFQN